MKGEREEVRIAVEVVFTYVFCGPKASLSPLAVSACGGCPGQSMTSCSWGYSTTVSDTAPLQEQKAWRGEGHKNTDTLRSAGVVGSGPREVHFAIPEL